MLSYIFFAAFLAIACSISLLYARIRYSRGRSKILRKVDEARVLLNLISSCEEFYSIEAGFDKSEFPAIYSYCQNNTGAMLWLLQHICDGFNSVRFSKIIDPKQILKEIVDCPDMVREFMIKQSIIISELHGLLFPLKSKLLRIRMRFLLSLAKALLRILKLITRDTMGSGWTNPNHVEEVALHKPVQLIST